MSTKYYVLCLVAPLCPTVLLEGISDILQQIMGFPGGTSGKEPPANSGDSGDAGLIPGSGRSGGGHGSPLQYSCLENPMDRGAW